MTKRIRFDKGRQRDFIQKVCSSQKISLKKLSEVLNITYSSIKKYNQEYSLIPYELTEKLSKLANIKFPNEDILEILPDNWGAIKGGKKGIITLYKNYEKELKRWRSKGGSLSNAGGRGLKRINIENMSNELSYLIGVILGDGTITKYFIRISADYRYDQSYFKYLSELVERVIGIKPAISRDKKTNLLHLRISSKEFCEYMHNRLKIPYGDKVKGHAKVPEIILNNLKFSKSCLRGLMDTDGSVSRRGDRLALVFTSHNSCLLEFVFNLNKQLNIFTHRNKTQIGTDSLIKIKKYFRVIGSSNPRYIARFDIFMKSNRLLYKEEIISELPNYINIHLPYFFGLVV